MTKRSTHAVWSGNLKEGSGTMKLGSGLFEGPYSYASRFEKGDGTNPEEMIGAALASCYAMFLASLLAKNNYQPRRVDVDATVFLGHADGAPAITKIELLCRSNTPDISDDKFMSLAKEAKEGCPVSKALAVEIELDAALAT